MLAFYEAVKPLLMGPDDMGNTFDHIPLHSNCPAAVTRGRRYVVKWHCKVTRPSSKVLDIR